MVLYHSSPSKIITPTFALGEGRHGYGKAQGVSSGRGRRLRGTGSLRLMWMPRQRRLKLTVRSRLLGDMPNGTFVLPKKTGAAEVTCVMLTGR